jgi:protein-S-isoprenylcysteine O-methyltransferase Ste14
MEELNLSIQLYNAWILNLAYFIISVALLMIMPKYNSGSFIRTPRVKYATAINNFSYYGFLISGLWISFSNNSLIRTIGLIVYLIGILLYSYALFSFAVKEINKPVTNRFYKHSRHPVYFSFFIVSFGIAFASFSFILMSFACIYFVSSYFIIKKEEEWCKQYYGDEYINYMKQTRMFI